MSDQETVSASGGADPAAFDFNAYINQAAKFPTFEHVIYLDQASGAEMHTLREEYDALAARGKEILHIQENSYENTSRSLVDSEAENLAQELEQIVARTDFIAPQINELRRKIQATSLKLHFQCGTPEKLGQIIRQAEKEFHKKHGRKNETDVEYITAKAKAVLAAQLTGYCTGITLPDGTEQEVPSADSFVNLMDKLITSESVRLMECLNKNLDGANDWAGQVDAGFLGGRDDAPEEPLGGAGHPDSEVMEFAAADPADG